MPADRGPRSNFRHSPFPPGIRRTSWTRAARVADAQAQGRAWRRRRARNRIVSVPRAKLAFPTGMRTKLRFCHAVQFEPDSADQIVHYTYRANGLTDPTATGTGGHQPRGFDQFMGVYRAYTVVGSKIMVNFVYEGYDGPAELDNDTSTFLIKTLKTETNGAKAAGVAPVMVGVHKGVTALTAGSATQTMEQDRTIWRPMTPQDGAVTCGFSMRTSDFFGKGRLVGAEGYTGSITADPDNLIYFDVWAGRASNQTAGKVLLRGFVTIEYDVEFTEPKTLTES